MRLRLMRSNLIAVVFTGLALGAFTPSVRADGGVLVLDQRAGPFLITAFAAPAPLRAGPVDLSVLVRDATTGRPILDAEVALLLERLRADGSPLDADAHDAHDAHTAHAAHATAGSVMRARATREEATNKLLRAALLELPAEGAWRLTISVARAGAQGVAETTLTAGPPLPAWLTRWKLFALPPLVVALFLANRFLAARRTGARTVDQGATRPAGEATRPSRGSAGAP